MGRDQAFGGFFASVNEFPEVFGLAQDFIFPCGRGDVGAEQKVVQAVGVQNAVDDHFAFNDFKVDAVVPGYVAVKNFAILFHLAEAGVIKGLEGGFRDLEVPEQVQIVPGWGCWILPQR